MTNKENIRAGNAHWEEYVQFLSNYPSMLTDSTQKDLWLTLTSRLNRVNECKKTPEKWMESVTKWKKNVIKKQESGAILNNCESTLIRLITENKNKQLNTNYDRNVNSKANKNKQDDSKVKYNLESSLVVNQPSLAKYNGKINVLLKTEDKKKIEPNRNCSTAGVSSVRNQSFSSVEYNIEKNLLPKTKSKKEVRSNGSLPIAGAVSVTNQSYFSSDEYSDEKNEVPKTKYNKEMRSNGNCPIAGTFPVKNKSSSAKYNAKKNVLPKTEYDTKVNPTENRPVAGVLPLRYQDALLHPLKIYYQNVRGLRTKLERFSGAVLKENYDVVILTETWLLPAIASYRVFDDRYNVFRTDRSVLNSEKTIGGGVLIAVLKTHGRIKRHLTNGAVEEVWISLAKYDLVIGAVYFPPRTPETKFKEFLRSANIVNNSDRSIIVGDFNMRRVTWLKDNFQNFCIPTDVTVESFKTLLEGLKRLGVYQRNYIINATGVILDLVYSNVGLISVKTTDSPFVSPDYHHPPLMILLPLNAGKPTGG